MYHKSYLLNKNGKSIKSATYKTSQVTTDRNIQFKVGNITYTSATYLKLL